jgi:C4-dicarboxylate-specific signal transduction histidine kinase
MKLRIASVAFLFGCVSTGLAWLTLQPTIARMMNTIERLAPSHGPENEVLQVIRGFLPFYLALDLLVVTLICSLVLNLMVARPLVRMEKAIDQLGRLELEIPLSVRGGPLVSRIQAALTRMAEALRGEQAVTRHQLKELTATNERLMRAQTELVSAERLATVGKLAAGVAHEVGNPLGGILGYLELAKARAGASRELRSCLDQIDSEVQRINRIIRGLLDLGRPARGTLGPVDVAPIVESCVRLVGAGPDFTHVSMELEIAQGTVARGEAGPLSQVVINLLLNAAHAVHGKGRIVVRGQRRDGQVVVEVEDSGAGIPAEVLPRLFEPFFTTKPSGKGTGLGLAVSMHLVSSMGGQLSAANVEGGGARFTISLPAA